MGLALEMGTNVMLYLDDIQHTSPELLQKFISLCDAQRKIEGVWRGRTRTYDLRGKKFCVVMAGNPYTESGETFRIPDMLANRADVYNLGDILGGKADAFALSFLENSLTSNATLSPLATRDLGDVYKLIRMARGEPVATTELSHGYSGVELEEVLSVMRHLFTRAGHAAQGERRVHPLRRAGRRVPHRAALQAAGQLPQHEQDRREGGLGDDGGGDRAARSTITTAASRRPSPPQPSRTSSSSPSSAAARTPEQLTRWADIKAEFVRRRRMGGGDADPVTRLVGTLSGLGAELDAIKQALGTLAGASHPAELASEVRALRGAVQHAGQGRRAARAARRALLGDLARPRLDGLAAWLAESQRSRTTELEGWLGPRLDALSGRPPLRRVLARAAWRRQ